MEETLETINSLKKSAKQYMDNEQYSEAAEEFSNLLPIACELYGPQHYDTAELYMLYGISLYESFINQRMVEEAERAATEGNSTTNGTPKENAEEDVDDEASDNSYGDDPILGKFGGEENEDAEESDMAIAWETLEAARVIYSREDSQASEEDEKNRKLNLIRTQVAISQISREEGRYEESIEELDEALKVYESIGHEHPRTIADIFYNKGLTYLMTLESNKAIESFKSAVKTLQDLLTSTKNAITKESQTEIRDIIKNIQSLINECQDSGMNKDKITKNIFDYIKKFNNPSEPTQQSPLKQKSVETGPTKTTNEDTAKIINEKTINSSIPADENSNPSPINSNEFNKFNAETELMFPEPGSMKRLKETAQDVSHLVKKKV